MNILNEPIERRRENEQRLRNLFDQADVGIYVISAENGYLDVNARGLELLGYSRDELLRMTVADVLAPHEVERLAVEPPRMMSGIPHLAEWVHVRKDGSTFVGEVSARRLDDVSYLAIVRDLTERRRSEARLVEAHDRLRLAVEAGNIGLWDWNILTNAVYFSPEWKKQIGYAEEEVGNEFREWESRLHPDDREAALAHVRDFIHNPGAEYKIEFRLRHKDGTYRWIFSQAQLTRDATGQPVRLTGCHFDVTEPRRTEEKLRGSEQRLRGILDTMFVFVGLIDLDGRIMEVNQAPLEAAGLTRAETLGQTVPESYWFSYDPGVKQQVSRALVQAAAGGVARDDYVIRVAGDRRMTIDCTFAPLRDSSGRVVQIVGSAIDITERKQAADALARSEERLRLAVEGASLGTWHWDIRSGELAWSDRCLGIFGLPPGTSMSYERFLAVLHPEDRARADAAVQHALRHHCEYDMEFRSVWPDGTVHWAASKGRAYYDEAGAPLRMEGLAFDITERKATEEALRESEQRNRSLAAIVEFSEDAIISFALDGTILTWNEGATHLFGYSASEAIGCLRTILLPPNCENEWPRLFAEIRRGKSPPPYETIRRRKDGGLVHVSVRISPLKNPAGEIVGGASIARDLTREQDMQQQLDVSTGELRALAIRLETIRENEAIRIAREVHDGLGQSLTALNMDLVWMEKAIGDGAKSQHPELILARLRSMSDLLANTVTQVQRISADLRPSLLDDLGLDAALEWYASQFQKRSGIQCDWSHLAESPNFPKQIGAALFRIFQETLTNIARHSHATRVIMSLRESADEVVLEVSDDGVGFPAEQYAHSKSLGLLGMRERALVFGGTVEILSAIGRGACVRVHVPFPFRL